MVLQGLPSLKAVLAASTALLTSALKGGKGNQWTAVFLLKTKITFLHRGTLQQVRCKILNADDLCNTFVY